MLALREALDCGCEEALMLDVDGFIAEGSGENVFIVRDGVVYTPELSACLDGITRKTVINLAEKAGCKIVEKRITRDEVYVADEAFFTGTAAEVLPISELDGRSLGAGHRGPLTELMQKQYFDLVRGKIPEYSDWLAPVAK
jgi:branched-chain amino acid aminotransferase